MKSIILLLSVTFSNGQMATQSYTYDTAQECVKAVDRIMAREYPFKLKASCHTVVPEVPEVDTDKVSYVG
jgi:uncharacterized protein YegP (UPF0339 family)